MKTAKIVSILLIIWGCIGALVSSMMFGDIGLAGMFGSVSGILSGIAIRGLIKNQK